MYQINLLQSRLAAAILTFVLLAFCWNSFERAMSVDSFLMDESLQYYTAIGDHEFDLGHHSRGQLSKIIWHNFNDNLDPGGFTLLLNLWSRLSSHPKWLRALPFFLFALALLGSFFCFWRKSIGRFPVALLLTAFLASYFPILNWSFILRAYSFEILGLAYLSYLIIYHDRKGSPLLYLPLVIFAFSRYSYLLFIGLFILFECQRQEVLAPKKMKRTLAVLLILSLLIAPLFALKLSPKLPLYIQQFTILYRLDNLSLLRELFAKNFSSLTYGLFILQIVLVSTLKTQLSASTRRFFFFTLCSHSIFIYLSTVGLYPWVMGERFGLSLSYLTFLSGGFILIDVFLSTSELRKTFHSPLLLILLIVPILQVRRFHFDSYSAIAPAVDRLPLTKLAEKSVYLGHNAFFEAYFLFDLGRYKDHRELFTRFDYDRPRGSLKPTRNYQYLVISQLDRANRKVIEEELKLIPINSDSRTLVYKVGH